MKESAFEFAIRVDKEIEELTQEEYLQKKPRHAKKLIEELFPLSRLALNLKRPGLSVTVETFDTEEEEDAIIYISGFLDLVYPIQIAFDYNNQEALRNEHLVKKGWAAGSGPITRDKKTKEVVCKMVAVDIYSHISLLSDGIFRLLRLKAEKNYATRMILLISIDNAHISGLASWKRLMDSVNENSGVDTNKFISVYIFNKANSEIQKFF